MLHLPTHREGERKGGVMGALKPNKKNGIDLITSNNFTFNVIYS
jgi:hypothetical protein